LVFLRIGEEAAIDKLIGIVAMSIMAEVSAVNPLNTPLLLTSFVAWWYSFRIVLVIIVSLAALRLVFPAMLEFILSILLFKLLPWM